MSTAVLLLNADHTPIKVISWEKAVYLLLDQKVTQLEKYADKVIRSASFEMAWPSVVVLNRYIRTHNRIRFNRANVFARDGYTCMYCGFRPRKAGGGPDLEELTLDHVVPRAQSRDGTVVLPWNGKRVSITCWDNAVAACYTCNSDKADHTPAQAGMTLRAIPRKPTPWDAILMSLTRTRIPEEWKEYLPADSPWKDYWDGELEPT